MADQQREYVEGERVTVYASAQMRDRKAGGVPATIIRRMPDADDYEVAYDGDMPSSGPFVTPERLELAV